MVVKAMLVPVTKPLHVHHIMLPYCPLSNQTCSATPLRAAEGAADVAPPTTDAVEEGVDARLDRDVEAFPRSSRVTSTG